MLEKPWLLAKTIGYAFGVLGDEIGRGIRHTIIRLQGRLRGYTPKDGRDRTIVVVGASFAGYHAARLISLGLPATSPYKVVVIEPNSHFQFSWVLPRFCVVKDHEDKAFIPYGGYVAGAPEGAVRWIQDRVVAVDRGSVRLQGSQEVISYDYLVLATGSGVDQGLPSRVNATEKIDGIRRLQKMQQGIEAANKVVVVGGGAAGVEVATDAKDLYPKKTVVLVHSRSAVMNRFGKGLQDAAMEGLKRLGIEVILGQRVTGEDAEAGTVTLTSGQVIECDLFINCTGQKPSSEILKTLSPNSISQSGHVQIKKTLQVADDALPNVFICGDLADTTTRNPNARVAMRQANIVADNILRAVRGKSLCYHYVNKWSDGVIKLTLGLDRSVSNIGDGHSELLFPSKEKNLDLMSAMCWSRMGAKPFEDDYMKEQGKASELGDKENIETPLSFAQMSDRA